MTDGSRGRMKIWSCWITSGDGIGYPHLGQVACIFREIYNRKGEKVSKEITIQITSAGAEKMSASDMNRHTREHWGIENKSHYVRDTLYREDHNQSREGNGPQALASLHNFAARLFRMKGVKSIKETTELIHMDRMLALNYMTTVRDGCCAALSLNSPEPTVPRTPGLMSAPSVNVMTGQAQISNSIGTVVR
jgi:predicted transposase YbfD/YdcC